MKLTLLLILALSFPAFAQQSGPSLCEIFDLPSCSGVSRQTRRSSAQSLPSSATSASLNPATVSYDRGFGLEFIHQPGNALVYNLATGSGKVGGVLISSNMENAFFGNRVPEMDDERLKRQVARDQYRPEKLSLAMGAKLISKNKFGLDAGVIVKRHHEIKKINTGGGLSARLGPISLGASYYQDDFQLDFQNQIDRTTGIPYQHLYGVTKYQEQFHVLTYSIGGRYKKFAYDTGVVETRFKFWNDEVSRVNLHSFAYVHNNFLFNLALRTETNPGLKYKEKMLLRQENKTETFGGVQYSLGKHYIFGINYNYFLLREISFAVAIFI